MNVSNSFAGTSDPVEHMNGHFQSCVPYFPCCDLTFYVLYPCARLKLLGVSTSMSCLDLRIVVCASLLLRVSGSLLESETFSRTVVCTSRGPPYAR